MKPNLIHSTLRQRPMDRLERERPFLKLLPSAPAGAVYKEVERKIQGDYCVAIDNPPKRLCFTE